MANRVPVGTPTTVTPPTPSSSSTGTIPQAGGMMSSPPQAPPATGVKSVPQAQSTAKAPATTDTQKPIMTKMTAQELKTAIQEIDGLMNPLDQFLNTNYRFRLFLTNDQDYVSQLVKTKKGDRAVTVQEVLNAVDQLPQVTICETGVTAGLNIEDVRMEQLVGPSDRARNTNVTQITMTVHEPLGTSFMEVMRNAALDMDVANLDKCPYFLELSFLGYDEVNNPGTIVTNVLANDQFDNGGKWIWQVAITKLEVELESAGSIYTLTMIPYNETVYDEDYSCFPVMSHVSGTTIQDLLGGPNGLKQALNKAFADLYGRSVYAFDFNLHGINNLQGQPPEMWKLSSNKPDFEDGTNFDWDLSKTPMLNIYSGARVADIIDHMFASTQRAVEIAKGVQLASEVNQMMQDRNSNQDHMTRQQCTADLFRKAVLFRVEPEVELGIFDVVLNTYHKHITFHIWGYYTQQPVLDPVQEDNAKDNGVQALMLADLVQRGFFRRRYNYLYTGLNTEVIRLDIKYDMAWSVALPMVAMYGTNVEQSVTQAKRTLKTPMEKSKQYQEELSKLNGLNEEISRNQTEINNDKANGTDSSTLEKSTADLQKQAVDQQKKVDDLKAGLKEVDAYVSQQAAQRSAAIKHKMGTAYSPFAEDIQSPSYSSDDKNSPLPLMIAYRQLKTGEGKQQVGTGAATPVSGDRGLYGAILEQVYGPITAGLINIEMEIRGDPYWLSYSNIERKIHQNGNPPDLSPKANMANYQEGDNVVLLTFDYPYDINASTGDIEIRTNTTDMTRKDRFVGMYRIARVTHLFSGGEFRQTLTGIRYPLVDLAKALGYDGIIDGGVAKTGTSGTSLKGSPAARQTPITVKPTPNQSAALQGVNPDLQRLTARAQQISAANGVPFVVTSGARSSSATAANSQHLTGNAVDVHPVINGQVYMGADGGSYQAPTAQYQTINNAYAQASLETGIPYRWGGASSTFIHGGNTPAGNGYDAEHFDLGGASPAQLGGPYGGPTGGT